MQKNDLAVLEMLGCINEDLDIDQIEKKFIDLVSHVFSFDRVALFFVKHKKAVLQGKLSTGFDPGVIEQLVIPLQETSPIVKPLVTGLPLRSGVNDVDRTTRQLQMTNYALVPILSKKRVACWEVKKCRAEDCPAYGKKWVRCWLASGTKCMNNANASPAEKSAQCAECSIFANMSMDSVEGVMLVDNSLSQNPITDEVITVLSIIAHTVGMAVNNSKIYQKTLDEAIRDELTGLHNRRYFNERFLDEVERAGRYGETLSFVLCDIDHFKRVNDAYGHPTGDEVLRVIAAALRNALRKNDVLARYGGEEFSAILINSDKMQATGIAEKLRQAIEEMSFAGAGRENIRITASFGVSTLGDDGRSCEGLVVKADRALYQAKAQGRNRVCSS